LLAIPQAYVFSQIVSGAFLQAQGLDELQGWLAALLALSLGRPLLTWGSDAAAVRFAIAVKDRLREQMLSRLYALGPAWLREERSGELANTLSEGVEALEGYYSQYLPQLFLAAAVPLAILAAVFSIDTLSGLVLLLTGPLIPFFMALIGSTAASATQHQWTALSRMSAYFLDVIQGLTALKIFGRSREQAHRITQVSERFRLITMRVLRVTFLSALALEWLSTLSTAIVAVQIGLRLLYGQMGFWEAFLILVLAPEYYAPLRALGLRFHAATAGKTAAARIFAILDQPVENPIYEAEALQSPKSTSSLPAKGGSGDIMFDQVSFSYSDGFLALDRVSMRLPESKATALVGPSGAGKTTLAGLLLGFWMPSAGKIQVGETALPSIPTPQWRARVAWAPQNPYLFNGTILDNLRLADPHASFEAIQEAARLAEADEFIQALPQGYHTILGERGRRLSGGQAQRLALARAFLKDAGLVILDEPTAHLDPLTEHQISRAVKRLAQKSTVLTIAHRLSTIQSADQVIVLKEGRVAQSGAPQALAGKPGVLQEILKAAQDPSPLFAIPPQPVEQSAAGGPPGSFESADAPAAHPAPPSERMPSCSHRASRPFAFLLSLMKPFARQVGISVLLGFGAIASGMGLMGSAAYIIARAAQQPSIADLQVAIVGVRFFGLGRGLLRYLERLASHQAALLLLAHLRTTFYQALEPLAPARLLRRRSGDLLNQIVSDINSLENFYVRGFAPLWTAALVNLTADLFFGLFSWWIGLLIALLLLASGGGLSLLAFTSSRTAGSRLVMARSRLKMHLVDCLQGMPDLLIFDQAERYIKRAHRAAARLSLIQRHIGVRGAALSALGGGLAQLTTWAVLALAVSLASQELLDGVWIGALALMTLASFEAVQPLPAAAQRLSADHAAALRLQDVIAAPPLVQTPFTTPERPPPKDFTLQIENLAFTYPPEPGAAVPPALKNINLTLPPGKRMALVGPSGAGKTTLVNLLLRFWEPTEGHITIGGVDLRQIDPVALRQVMAVLPQNPYLFNASVREHLRLARPEAGEAEMVAACRQAQIADVVLALPMGLDTWLGEGGARLSAGERQRLALAQALLKNSPLLILDEPAAHLDSLSERALFSVISQPRPGQAILAITHRLAKLENFDEIIVLEQGCILERGGFKELASQNGLFHRMWLQEQDGLGLTDEFTPGF
jgi:ATP-binding cassette, subfamily C, bacterial CydCD